MQDEIKNVFISHVHEDDDGLGDIKGLLSKHRMAVRDGSINSDKPNNARNHNYIKSEILAPRIKWASTLLVYISPKTKTSDWVNWEIEYAAKCGKRIVGVWAHGANECDIPEALDEYADAVVGWRGERVIDAINGKINNWENSDGTLRGPRQIVRISCQ
jgi:hypothetical protein